MNVLVTGGSKGIGLGICRRFLDEGAHVTTCAREETEELRAERERSDGKLLFVSFDLSAENVAERFNREFNHDRVFDAVVLNAAIERAELFATASSRNIRECMDVNVIGTMQVVQCCLRRSLANAAACSFVFLSSVAAERGLRGLSVYGASKAAISGLARGIAVEYGAKGIRANVVVPGFVDGGMAAHMQPELKSRIVKRTPARRAGEVEEIVDAVAYLAGKRSRYVNGTELRVDGGFAIA